MNPTGNWGIRFPGMDNEAFVAEVAKELDELLMWEAIACEAEQRELAQLYNDRPPEKCVDGIGPQILAITPTAYIHYKAIEKLDFSNPKDIQYLINRHPHMRVRDAKQTVKTQVGYMNSPHWPPRPGDTEKGKASPVSVSLRLCGQSRGSVRTTQSFASN